MFIIIRDNTSGVIFGEAQRTTATRIVLKNARQIFSWENRLVSWVGER